jgi:hypothetical protein
VNPPPLRKPRLPAEVVPNESSIKVRNIFEEHKYFNLNQILTLFGI